MFHFLYAHYLPVSQFFLDRTCQFIMGTRFWYRLKKVLVKKWRIVLVTKLSRSVAFLCLIGSLRKLSVFSQIECVRPRKPCSDAKHLVSVPRGVTVETVKFLYCQIIQNVVNLIGFYS